MKQEIKICQKCKEEFKIEPEDFDFYEKIKVPPPTFCPECRLIRRMTWRNERSLFKRPCAKSGKEIITMFHPEADVVVYDHDVWWGDSWEPTDYGQEYDFSKPFFEQYKELLRKVPLANLGNQNCVGSPYGNHNADCKFCYLIYASYNNERTHYSSGLIGTKDSMDLLLNPNSELCYEDVLCAGLYRTHFSFDSDESLNSYFLTRCKNLQDSIGCVNLNSKNHAIFNKIYSKEEYEEEKKKYDFGSYKALTEFKDKYKEFVQNFPTRYASIIRSENVTGDYIMNSKNLKNCFEIYNDAQDGKYVYHAVNFKDCYDMYGGGISSLMYEGVDSGLQSYQQFFSVLAHTNVDSFYTYMCYNSKDLFGCVGMRGKQYCILNKQYTKEEYFELLPKVFEHSKNVPYVDKEGLEYRFGEFFPSELSPFAYNETIAQEHFSKTKNEIEKQAFKYREPVKKDYHATILAKDLPDHIKDTPESILKEVIACPNNGDVKTQCTQAFRIIKSELDFLKKENLALPRYCPNCRHYARMRQRNPFKLWKRGCHCAGEASENNKYKNTRSHFHDSEPCPNTFETSFDSERPEIIYCEKCYQAEVF